jgi:uncharacterized tellurite resistance protein B-like protein
MMIAKLKQFFQSGMQTQAPEQQGYRLRLAAACLLMEVVHADDTLKSEEAELLPELLIRHLDIAPEDAELVLAEAELAQDRAVSLFEFTNLINAHFSLEQKQQLLLCMWRLAFADGELSRFEDQIIRRTADLLYLKHSELIRMRNLARAEF